MVFEMGKGKEGQAAAWEECLRQVSGVVPEHLYGLCLASSGAQVVKEGLLRVETAAYALERLRRAPSIKEAVRESVRSVFGETWQVEFEAREMCARQATELREQLIEPKARTRKTAGRGLQAAESRVERTSTGMPQLEIEEAPECDAPAAWKRFSFDNFVVGQCNRMAVESARRVAELPGAAFNPLVIYGESGLGKTHLMLAVRNRMMSRNRKARVAYTTSESFTNELIDAYQDRGKRMNSFRRRYRNVDVLLVDDVEFLIGKERTQEEFYHTFEDLSQRGCQLVLTCDRSPRLLTQMLDRLCSRLNSGLIADIQRPQHDTCIEILKARARDANAHVATEALSYIAEHFSASVRHLEGALVRVLAFADANRVRQVDGGLARQALDCMRPAGSPTSLSMPTILDKVSQYYRVSVTDLVGTRRDRRYSAPRHIAMYLAARLASIPCKEIARCFGGKDYSTVKHAINKIETQRATTSLKVDLTRLAAELGRQMPG